MKKKILLSILCICMVLTMMPTLAFADVAAETPSTKGVKPQFENATIYVKTENATEAIFKVKNPENYNAEGTWKVYESDFQTTEAVGVTIAYDVVTAQLKLTNKVNKTICRSYGVSYTPKDGIESDKKLITAKFQRPDVGNNDSFYVVGDGKPLMFSKSDNGHKFTKITYTVGAPNVEETEAVQNVDYTITTAGPPSFAFTNVFLKGLLPAGQESTTVYFNFYYDESAINVNNKTMKLIDKVKESKTDLEELKWKKGNTTNLKFRINDNKDCYIGSLIDGAYFDSAFWSKPDNKNTPITLTLASTYLQNLPLGWHKIEFFFGEEQSQGPMRLLSDRGVRQRVYIAPYLRHVVGWFLIFDENNSEESYGPNPDNKPTDPPVVYPSIVYPPVVTPVVPDTPVVPVPPVVEPVEPAKPDPTVEPAKPDTPVDGDESSTTNLKTDTENNKSNSPQTGDNTNPWTWIILFGMSGIGLGSILINKKRNTNI